MNLFFALPYLLTASLLVIWPQEKPPADRQQSQQQPQQPPSKAREAALEAIKNATPVEEERSVSSGSASRRAEATAKGSGGTVRSRGGTGGVIAGSGGSGVGGGGSAGTASPKTVTKVSDTDKKASALFVGNALYQQELANRRQIISVEDVTTPEAALAELEAGNLRFISGGRVRTLMTAQEPELRSTLAKGQSPFAVVVACSDSRVMDNILFDQELGRVFSIRLAGNSPDTAGIASIEYAVEHLRSKLVIVVGHTKCGAIGAVADAKGEPLPDNLYIFQQLMSGLLDVGPRDPNEPEGVYKDRLGQLNAVHQAQAVYDRSRIIQELVEHEKIWLLPALYDLDTGKVTFYRLVEAAPHSHSGH
jgi:carbonic anhydrase